MAKRSGSSQRWLKRQRDDIYVAHRQAGGYRSRAAFKLAEIDRQERLFRPGMRCVDLGAAPGGWSQVAAQRVGTTGRVWAVDLSPMEPLDGVEFIQGDFREAAVVEELKAAIGKGGIDLVMSDMAPNITGNRGVDQARSMDLVHLALELAREVLVPGGSLLIKLFQGEGFEEFRRELARSFATVKSKKPPASRAGSREMYLLARNYRI